MRIISGKLGGRTIEVSERGADLRPTSSRVREAVFSALDSMNAIEDVRVLDLYAGSGSLGIEALSRGAASAVFVESSRDAVRELKQNILALGLGAQATAQLAEAEKFLSVKNSADIYKLVFADPPYAVHPGLRLAALLAANGWVDESSVLVVEASSRSALEQAQTELPEAGLSPRFLKDKTYGDTKVYYFGFEKK